MWLIAAVQQFFNTIQVYHSFIGKLWWLICLFFRLGILIVFNYGFTADDPIHFYCYTRHNSTSHELEVSKLCHNYCFNLYNPISVTRMASVQLIVSILTLSYSARQPCLQGSAAEPFGAQIALCTSAPYTSWCKLAPNPACLDLVVTQ